MQPVQRMLLDLIWSVCIDGGMSVKACCWLRQNLIIVLDKLELCLETYWYRLPHFSVFQNISLALEPKIDIAVAFNSKCNYRVGYGVSALMPNLDILKIIGTLE
jgi:hypothetical protein